MTGQTRTRRRSPSLFVSFKETDRMPPSSLTARHRHPWNKYGKETVPKQRWQQAELSSPTRQEFVRIHNWSIEKRKFEERQAELQRQRDAILQQRQAESLEATRLTKKSLILEDIQKRREKREMMQKERISNHKRYLAFRQHARLRPLLHELRQNDFDQALKRNEHSRLEWYNTKVKPFRTVRPGQIVSTNVLKQLGKMVDVEEKVIPHEEQTQRVCVQTHVQRLPPPTLVSAKAVPSDGSRTANDLKSSCQDETNVPNDREEFVTRHIEHDRLKKSEAVNNCPTDKRGVEALGSGRRTETTPSVGDAQTPTTKVTSIDNATNLEINDLFGKDERRSDGDVKHDVTGGRLMKDANDLCNDFKPEDTSEDMS